MSNLSKTIAILGVVAGLGITALPLSSYAVESTDFKAAEEGTPRTVDSDAVPLQLEVTDYLEIATEFQNEDTGAVILKSGADTNGANYTGDLKVYIRSNATNGYTLNMKPTAAANVDMVSEADADDKIVPITTAGAFNADGSSWAYQVVLPPAGDSEIKGAATGMAGWTAITESGATILTQTGLDAQTTTETGRAVPLFFGAKVASDQPAGVYKTSVTFTATNAANS